MMLKIERVSKSFRTRQGEISVLREIDLELPAGSTSAVIGPSGSGKTTLLGLCAGLDRPSSGRIWLDGIPLNERDEDQLARLRNELTGFVFQMFRLIPSLTALENVMIPAELRGGPPPRRRATELLVQVGLAERLHHYPSQLSGGEQQRVAIARAFINQPRMIFADEPTGNLDGETGAHILDLLFALNRDQGATLLLVTHDQELTRRVQQVITLRNGQAVRRHRNPVAP